MVKISDFLFGRKDQMKQQPLLNLQQQQALSQFLQQGIDKNPLYGAGSNYLQNLLSGSPESFQNFEAPYLQNFQQNIVPGIAERFAGGLGYGGTGAGALSSSALNNSLAQAGRSLQGDLAGLRSGLQMQALPQALGYAQQPYSNQLGGLGVRSFENTYQPGNIGFLGQGLQGALGGLGGGLGLGFGSQLGGSLFNSLLGGLNNRPPTSIGMTPGMNPGASSQMGRPGFNLPGLGRY
jgi:hypothetical protein